MQTRSRFFFGAGFECASHVRADGVRLDLTESSQHERMALQDYGQVSALDLRDVRDGLRWHRIEETRSVYDWSSWIPMLHAAREANVRVTWDLCHYGWPDHLNIWSHEFVEGFARFSRAAARQFREESDQVPCFCPINEMSYLAWAGGQVALMNPGAFHRADELKRQLARAYMASVDAIRSVDPRARFLISEPLIHVASQTSSDEDAANAEAFRLAQFQAADMLLGTFAPELGGSERYLDIVGVNYYPHNQWYLDGPTIPFGHFAYRPLHCMLKEVADRYRRTLVISETGAEASARPYWLHHVCGEVLEAQRIDVRIEGLYIYPILNYPGWNDARVCEAGLLSTPSASDQREVYEPYRSELVRQQMIFATNAKALRLAS